MQVHFTDSVTRIIYLLNIQWDIKGWPPLQHFVKKNNQTCCRFFTCTPHALRGVSGDNDIPAPDLCIVIGLC